VIFSIAIEGLWSACTPLYVKMGYVLFFWKKILPPNVFEKIIDSEDAKMKIICPCSF
jgi:hypothetical protein